MKKGWAPLPNVNAHTEQIIRFAGFLIPVLLFLYGWLLKDHVLGYYDRFSATAFFGISAVWLVLSIYQFLVPAKVRGDAVFRLIVYHVLAAAYLIFVSGLSMPLTACWVVLFLVSLTYFGTRGLSLSMGALVVAALVVAGEHYFVSREAMSTLIYCAATLVIGYVVSTLTTDQEVDREALSKSQAANSLERERVLTLVNNLADAILSTDKDGVIQVYNAACLNLLDTNKELSGLSIDHAIHLVDESDQPFKLMRRFRTIRSVESREDLRATISGETIRLSVTYSPIRGTNSAEVSGEDGYIVILRDITKQKSLEEERDEFISVISHELRTPITIAEGSLSNVRVMMERPDIPKATLAEGVRVSHEQVLFLAQMVNDLSTLSRAERGVADEPERIDVAEVIHDLYKEYAPQAEAKGLHFNLDLSPHLGTALVSKLYLKELLQNFVTNAIKYTHKGEIVVGVKKSRNVLKFSVKDTGMGISKSDQNHVFEKFWRSEDYRTRETGGTGLGLYVARKLSHKLATTITMTSRLNHGSTFGFELPSADSDQKDD